MRIWKRGFKEGMISTGRYKTKGKNSRLMLKSQIGNYVFELFLQEYWDFSNLATVDCLDQCPFKSCSVTRQFPSSAILMIRDVGAD